MLSNLPTFQANADVVRARLRQIALDERERERVRVMAAHLLVSIDEPTLSETTIEVLAAHLASSSAELRRQAVLRVPESLGRTGTLLVPLTRVARGEPSQTSVRAADVLGRWDAMGRDELVQCLVRGLRAEDLKTVDLALESPLLPTLNSEPLVSRLVELLSDGEQSFAWIGESPIVEGGFERRHAALIVIARLPEGTRQWIRRSLGTSVPLPAAEEPLLRLCLEGPASVSDEEALAMLGARSPSRTWTAVRVLIDQEAIVGPLRLPAARLAFSVSHRSALFRMLGRWIQGLPAETVQSLVAQDGTEYFRWRLEQLTGLDVGR